MGWSQSMELCGLNGERGTPCLRNAPSRVPKTAALGRDETPNALGVVVPFFFFLKHSLLALRSLGNVESRPPKPLNAQTAQDRDENLGRAWGRESRTNKHAVKVFPQPVNTVFQEVQKETEWPPPPSLDKRVTLCIWGASSQTQRPDLPAAL